MNNQSPIYCENGLQYTLNEEGAFIYRYEGDDEKLVIPDTLGGKTVIGLLARSLANTKATPNPSGCSIHRGVFGLSDGLEEVGNYTFAGCTGLESVELPASLRSFGVSLFQGCTGLTDVYLRGGARTWCRRNVIRKRRTNFPDQAVFRYK